MNPLVRYLIKQIEDSAVMVEKFGRPRENLINQDQVHQFNEAFNDFHSALSIIKNVAEELMS